MPRSYQTLEIVPESHILTLRLPADLPTGPVQITVDYAVGPQPQAWAQAEQAADLTQWLGVLASLPPSPRSLEQINQQIAAMRDDWA